MAHLRLPAPSILPATGALVGIYAGLAAGLFGNLISAFHLLGFGASRLLRLGLDSAGSPGWRTLREAPWHPEFMLVGAVLAVGLLTIAQLVPDPGGDPTRAETRTRLRVMAFLILGGLALFYPLVGLAAVNGALGEEPTSGLMHLLDETPWALRPLVPALGGALVASILRNTPEARGGGLGQVVQVVQGGVKTIPMRVGLVKLLASSVTIGSGGSAGREGPIVQVGGSVGSTVAEALGFTRRDLAVLVGCGSAGGIAASFDAPIAGVMFALEIILREFEVRVFAPIVLASVSATMTARAVMGAPAEHAAFRFTSTLEIGLYAVLGLACGGMAIAYVRGLDGATALFRGQLAHPLSRWLASRTETERCMLGGVAVGLVGCVAPSVMGAGHESLAAAVAGELPARVLFSAAALKLVSTAITLGSGASGGTFFPALFVGAMSGGAFGALLQRLFPESTGGAGSYALVGMAACVAGSTRAPLTAIVIVFELTNNYTAILPLMVACTISSTLCHAVLGEATGPGSLEDAIPDAPVGSVMEPPEPVLSPDAPFAEVRSRLLASRHGMMVLARGDGPVEGLVVLRDIQETLLEELGPLVRARDVARPMRSLPPDLDLRTARDLLEEWELLEAPVVDGHGKRIGTLSLAGIRAAARERLTRSRSGRH